MMDELPTDVIMNSFETSKGGVKYQLVMSDIDVRHVKGKKRLPPVSKAKPSSLQEIQLKQEQAEVRRLHQRNTRKPSQHLNRNEKVREANRRSISEIRSFMKKESNQRIKGSEIRRKDRIRSMQVKKKRPETAHVSGTASYKAKCLEEHLNIQTRLLGELSIHVTRLIGAVKELVPKNF